MCMGGSNSASQQAQQQVQQQQQRVSTNVGAINAAFAGRGAQYTDYLKSLRQSYTTELNRQQQVASRGLKFALARNGQTGGSVAADQGGELRREMAQGTLSAEQQAQAKVAGLKSQDEAERLQMISLAQAGGNIGDAEQQTATALQANIQNAEASIGPSTVGNVFGGVSDVVNNMNTAAQTRLGLRAAQAYTQPFTNSPTTQAGFAGPSH